MKRIGAGGLVLAICAVSACQFPSEDPPDRAGDPKGYCAWLASNYSSYVGAIGPEAAASTRGAQGGLEARVAAAQCQQGNIAEGTAVLERKLIDAQVLPPRR